MVKLTQKITGMSDGAKSGAAKVILFLSTIIWGSSFFVLKDTLDEVPPYFLLSFRFLVAAVLLGLICFRKWKLFNMTYLWQGVLTGVFLAFAYIFQTLGLQHTTPGTSAFLTTVYCVLAPLIGWAVTRKRPTLLNIAAAVVAVAGIGLVCLDGGIGFTLKGEGYTLICGVRRGQVRRKARHSAFHHRAIFHRLRHLRRLFPRKGEFPLLALAEQRRLSRLCFGDGYLSLLRHDERRHQIRLFRRRLPHPQP